MITMETHMTEDNDLISYCGICDLTFCGLHVTWYPDSFYGIAECPECGNELDVAPPDPDFQDCLAECWS